MLFAFELFVFFLVFSILLLVLSDVVVLLDRTFSSGLLLSWGSPIFASVRERNEVREMRNPTMEEKNFIVLLVQTEGGRISDRRYLLIRVFTSFLVLTRAFNSRNSISKRTKKHRYSLDTGQWTMGVYVGRWYRSIQRYDDLIGDSNQSCDHHHHK